LSLTRTFYVESLGCAKNQVDSEEMIAALEADGWTLTDDPAAASLIVVNSCGFIREAKEESIETSLTLKKQNPGARVILAGCLTERYADALRSELTEIDGFAGNRDPSAVAALARRLTGDSAARDPAPPRPPAGSVRRARLLSLPGSVYVKVAEGCDNRCTYCAIPLIRGELRSRPVSDVVEEVRRFVGAGMREVILVAQDLASYGADRGAPELEGLVDRILRIPGDYWLRLLYLHPDHFPAGILDRMRGDRRLLRYLDIPFQHASRRILGAMGRRGSTGEYLDLVGRIRTELPEAVLRSTFLVGFPGETEAEFEELLAFQERARLQWVGGFVYSREEGTPASELPGQLKGAVAQRRKLRIERAQVPITWEFLDRHLRSRQPVLLEEHLEGERLFIGRGSAQAPDVDGSIVVSVGEGRPLPSPGDVVQVRITARNGFDLEGVAE
jgi:ribosomal protein S12 methylthiotransferase